MKKLFMAILVSALGVCLVPAQQTTSDLYGSVVLSDGSNVPGVLVTLTGNVLGTRTATTSVEGNFRFLRLLPGIYDLKAEMDGFKTVIRKDIRLYAGKNVTLIIPLEQTAVHEEIVVTGKAGVVDTRRTNIGMNVTKEAIQSLPSGRNPWSVVAMAPGVMNDAADVGGSESTQQSHPNAGGSETSDTVWSVDGIDNSSLATAGTSTGYLDLNNYEELQVTTGATDITAPTGGVQINFVSKRGGNKMHGGLHFYYEDKSLEMSHPAPEYFVGDNAYVTPGINHLYQYGANLGGPIVKDKMWFFGTWSMQDVKTRSTNGDSAAAKLTNGYVKLDGQFGNTSAELHFSYDRKLNDAYLPKSSYTISQVMPDAWRKQTMPNYYWYGTLQQIMGKLMLTGKAGFIKQSFTFDPYGSNFDSATGHELGNEAVRYSRSYIKQSGSANNWSGTVKQADVSLDGNLFLEKTLGGDHEIRFGIDYNAAHSVSETLVPNQRMLYVKYYGDFTSSYGIWLMADNKIDINFARTAGYAADTITFKRFTLNLGLRYDLQKSRINKTDLPGYTWVDKIDPSHNGVALFPEWLGPLTIQQYKMKGFKTFSPRFSLSWDVRGTGKDVIKLSAARYGSRMGTSMAYPLLPHGGSNREIDVYWYDDGDGIPTWNELDSAYGFCYAYANYCTSIDYSTGRQNVRYDGSYNSPLLDELTMSYEKQLADDLAVSLTGIYKKQHNLLREIGIMEDGSVETKDNWYQAGTETSISGATVAYWNRHEVPAGVYLTNYKKNYNRYLGLQLGLSKKLSARWMADATFIVQNWKQYRFEEETFDMTNFDYWNGAPYYSHSMRGATDVFVNSRWQFKLAGLYQMPWGINASVVFSAQEGYIVGDYVESAHKQKGLGYFSVYDPNTKFGDHRLPAFYVLNLGLEKTFTLGSGKNTSLTVFVDAYNLTNNDAAIGMGAQYDSDDYGLVYKTLNPGIFQLGCRINF